MRVVIDISEHDKEWIGNAYGIPQDINTKIAEAIINAEPCHPEPHWILMKERLPSEGELVLLGDADENMTTGRLIRTDDGYKWDSDMFGWWNELGDWDAWIPLPDLYKGVTE